MAGLFALALTVGVASNRAFPRRRAKLPTAGEELKDAVASPTPPATVGLAGRPVPTSWFKTPAQHHAEIDSALLGSSHRRALARRVALQ
jgi:hypothetical protein